MNIQAITVIFIIIFLPIILVSNFYIQREMDTITIQNSYDTKLIDATTDAISAFELNTANEDLSLIPDSLRSIVEASTNVFTTTLATNLGMSSASKNKVLPYIPAIVFTLYDGYYIYSPTQQPKILVDIDGVYVKVGDEGVSINPKNPNEYLYNIDSSDKLTLNDLTNTEDYGKMLYCTDIDRSDPNKDSDIPCTTSLTNAYFVTNYMLKSFIPYSMQYKEDDVYDITINYTLDNYISIKGTIREGAEDIYYSKSGYLINPDEISKINISGTNMNDFSKTDTNSKVSLDTIDSIIDDVISNNGVCEIEFSNGVVIDATEKSESSKNSRGDTVDDNVSALKYYVKAYIFSSWVKANFSDKLTEANILPDTQSLQNDFSIKQSGLSLQDDAKIFWEYGSTPIFSTGGNWKVNDTDSNFIEHKRKVIKNSIQYNLNLAMAVYNAGEGGESYQMPILSDSEWDNILTNVSMIAFMQGFPCGLKTYNNYAIITSTKNEIMTNKNDIYYIPIQDGSGHHQGVFTDKNITPDSVLDTAHKFDCVDSSWIGEAKDADRFQSFSAKDMKYDKVYNYSNGGTYEYDHIANECYYCIVNPNYNSWLKDAINKFDKNKTIDTTTVDKLKNEFGVTDATSFIQKLLKAQLIADGKIKNNTFKSIAATTNYGINTITYVDNTSNITGNNLFTDYYNGGTQQCDVCGRKKFSSDTPFQNNTVRTNQISDVLKKYEADKCYEIDITISINNAGYSGHITPDLVFALGAEKTNRIAYKSGDQTLVFTDCTQWKKTGFPNLYLINQSNNFQIHYDYDIYGRRYRNGYDRSVITSGNISIKSITFKYK